VSSQPADGDVQVATNASLRLTFDNRVVLASLQRTDTTLTVVGDDEAIAGTWTIGENGRLQEHRVFAQLARDILPDGICLDAEGCVWVSTVGNSVLRVREGGEILEHINVTGGSTYACMLGGEERRDLYICVAPHHDRNVTLRERGGRIDVARVSVPGAGLP
jgi:sugar lactone lactonase YvrE